MKIGWARCALVLGLTGGLAAAGCGSARVVWFEGGTVEAEVGRGVGADAVVLERLGTIRFLSKSDPSAGYELVVRTRKKLLTPAGRSEGRLLAPLDPFTRLEVLAGRTYDPAMGAGGGIEFARVNGEQATLIHMGEGGRHRLAVLDVPGAKVGRIVETYQRSTIRRGSAIEDWAFDEDIPVKRSRLTVERPAGWSLKSGYAHSGALAPLESETSADGRWVSFELTNVPAREEEPWGVSEAHHGHRLRLAVSAGPEAPTWDDVAREHRERDARAPAVEPMVRDAILPSLAAVPPERRLDQTCRLVRDRIRNAEAVAGVAALYRNDPNVAARIRLGNPADSVALAIDLLAGQGVSAFPALVGSPDVGLFDPEVPTLAAFDHVLLAAPMGEGFWFCDPSRAFLSPGSDSEPAELPGWVAGQQALIVRPTDALLQTLPERAHHPAREQVVWTLEKDAISLFVQLEGHLTHPWRPLLDGGASPKVLEDRVASTYFPNLNAPGLRNVVVKRQEPERETSPIRIWAKANTAGLVHAVDGQRVVLPGRLLGSASRVRLRLGLRSPVLLGPARREERTVVLKGVPPGTRLPGSTEHETAFSSYRFRTHQKAGTASVQRILEIKAPRTDLKGLGKLRELHQTISRDARKVVVIPGGEG